jgi:thymidine kinase
MCKIEIIMGGMFSGKSTELIRRVKRHSVIGKRVLVINSSKDTRSENNVVKTHDGNTWDCVKMDHLYLVYPVEYDVIAIDEAQFFGNLKEFVSSLLPFPSIHVIIAGLDGDSSQKPFGDLLWLIPLADEVQKFCALCMECKDGTPGPFSKRLVASTEQELVGDCHVYHAVCRKHL